MSKLWDQARPSLEARYLGGVSHTQQLIEGRFLHDYYRLFGYNPCD